MLSFRSVSCPSRSLQHPGPTTVKLTFSGPRTHESRPLPCSKPAGGSHHPASPSSPCCAPGSHLPLLPAWHFIQECHIVLSLQHTAIPGPAPPLLLLPCCEWMNASHPGLTSWHGAWHGAGSTCSGKPPGKQRVHLQPRPAAHSASPSPAEGLAPGSWDLARLRAQNGGGRRMGLYLRFARMSDQMTQPFCFRPLALRYSQAHFTSKDQGRH